MRVAWIPFLLACLFAGLPPRGAPSRAAEAARDDLRDQAEALMARAREACDLQAKGNPAFRLRAQVRLLGLREGPLEGSYLWIWSDPGRWRIEIHLGQYQELAVGAPDKVWRRRTVPAQPYRLYQLEQLLGLTSRLYLDPQERVVEVGERDWQGVRRNYVQTQMKGGGREFWFDPASGAPVREKHDSLEDISAFEYSDYVAFGQKSFPRSLRLIQFGKPAVEVGVEELAVIPEPSPHLFNPPENATLWPRCGRTEPPRALKTPSPSYPERARRARAAGVARAYVVVGPDGKIHYSSVVRTPGEDFSAAIQKTLRKWRFQPAMCRGVPVDFSMFVEFTFHTVPVR